MPRICPKCGSRCNAVECTLEDLYITCVKCPYQTWESKHKIRNGLIHEIKEAYKEV